MESLQTYVWQFKIRILNLCDLAINTRIVLLIMLPWILWRVGVALLSDCILFLAVCTECDGKLNRGLATRLQFCVSYDRFYFSKKKSQHRCSCMCVRACVVCVCVRACVCARACVVCMHVWEVFHINLNEAVAQPIRITQGSTGITSSVSYVCLPHQYIAHL